jgi:hypothetical protein
MDMSIDFPVDVENTRWATWSISEAIIKQHNKRWPRADGGPIVGQDPDIVGLLEVQLDPPAYDESTHKLVATQTVDVPANQHIHGYDVVLLTQEELDEIAADEEWTQEQQTAKAQYDDLQNGVGTSAERVERTE